MQLFNKTIQTISKQSHVGCMCFLMQLINEVYEQVLDCRVPMATGRLTSTSQQLYKIFSLLKSQTVFISERSIEHWIWRFSLQREKASLGLQKNKKKENTALSKVELFTFGFFTLCFTAGLLRTSNGLMSMVNL